MNILLVDDNRIVLDSLLSGINFSDLGFQNVYTARSAKEAEEILHEKDIQIMIADIEMPGESGLKLLERVNHERTDMVTIFCTSYADFNYAQEAIRLHCFDYYVKPIKYKTFEEHLKKAIQEVEYRFRQKIEREYGEYWESNFWNIKVGFWHRLFFGLYSMPWNQIQQEIQERRLNYKITDQFIICAVKLKQSGKIKLLGESMSEFVFKNIIQETFPEPYVELEYIAFADDHTVIIVFKQGKGKMERFKSCCHLLLEKLCDHIVDSGNCYYITGVSLIDAQDCMEKLEEISIDDLLNNRAVINYIDFIKPDMGQLTEEFFKLEKNITAQNFQLLSQYVQTYFTAQENRNSISGQLLREMRFNIIQISLCVLKEKGINAYKIFGSPEYDQLFNRALKSLSDMKKFTQYIVDQTLQCLKESAQSQTSAGKVKKYIDKNFNKNITRNDLEKVAFTNLNMLSKDFKIETGYSLHGYIIERRINRAKELLEEGEKSVSEISLDVGYDNFSYFSRIFKDRTGYSPKEYKKQAKNL